MLAQALAPGAPCPVCGSIEHPRLAPSAPADASHEAVEACERAARGAAEAASKAYAAEAQAASRAKSARAQARDLREGLSLELLDPKEPSSAARERLSAAGLAKAEESKACESAAARLIEAQRAREAAKARAERALSAEQAARGEAVAAAAAASEASARVDALEAGNEAQSLDPILLAAERARGMGEMARLRARATACRIEAEEAARALALAEGVAAELAARAADLAARLAATEQRLGAMAAAAGFADASEAAQALLSAERQGEIEMRLLARAQAVAAAEDARARALAACASLGADTLNGAAIESELALADAAARAALEASAAAHEAERRFVEQARAIEVAYDRLLRDEAAFAALGRLAKVAQGLPPENATGVSLQRFVLGSQLDLVLERATHRLQRMTRGQFSLRRVRNRDDARRSAGLDIEVEDAYTGTARPASYLSGGESFMAALSLALGLADVAQEASGGSRLDAVFVDEGFGTLDSEALDQALRALADLSGADKRLVGVISHLPELREQIERRLLVSRGIRGSSIAWQ
jgi:exonuclease SbcC